MKNRVASGAGRVGVLLGVSAVACAIGAGGCASSNSGSSRDAAVSLGVVDTAPGPKYAGIPMGFWVDQLDDLDWRYRHDALVELRNFGAAADPHYIRIAEMARPGERADVRVAALHAMYAVRGDASLAAVREEFERGDDAEVAAGALVLLVGNKAANRREELLDRGVKSAHVDVRVRALQLARVEPEPPANLDLLISTGFGDVEANAVREASELFDTYPQEACSPGIFKVLSTEYIESVREWLRADLDAAEDDDDATGGIFQRESARQQRATAGMEMLESDLEGFESERREQVAEQLRAIAQEPEFVQFPRPELDARLAKRIEVLLAREDDLRWLEYRGWTPHAPDEFRWRHAPPTRLEGTPRAWPHNPFGVEVQPQ